ncbi:MAG: hypothetical protein ACI4F9_09185 [Lachnospiraceae bacterium]
MEFRITDNVSEQDIKDVYRELKEYNLSKLESSEITPFGAFYQISP